VPDEALGLHIIAAYEQLYPQWEWEVDGRRLHSFHVNVVRAAWLAHVHTNFPYENGDTLFHARFLREPIPECGSQKWLPPKDALRARWVECFQSMLRNIHEGPMQTAAGWGR
jgi:hypothetical protein